MRPIALLLLFLSALGWAADEVDQVFKEELRFGAEEEDPEYSWQDGEWSCSFDVAANGHFFVVDQRNSAVYEFDAQGVYVREVARRGEGPGENSMIPGFYFKGGGAEGVNFQGNNLLINQYNATGEFQAAKRIPNKLGFPLFMRFAGESGAFSGVQFGGPEGRRLIKVVIDNEFQPIKELCNYPWANISGDQFGDPNAWVNSLGTQIRSFLISSYISSGVLADGRIVVGNGNKGTFDIYAAGMKKHLKTMKTDMKPVPFREESRDQMVELITDLLFKQVGPSIRSIVTPSVINRAITKADLPAYHAPIYEILTVEKNVFAVVNDVNYGRGNITMTFYDTERGKLGTAALPDEGTFSVFGTRLKFHQGKAYAMVWNEDDENQIVRYDLNLAALK